MQGNVCQRRVPLPPLVIHTAGHKFAENILDFAFARNGRPL
jgi:hypothetical protein